MNKSFAWTVLAVLAFALSFGGAQTANQAQAIERAKIAPKPILKPDLVAVSLEFQFVSNSIANGKTIRTFKVKAKVKNAGPGSSPACQLDFWRAMDWHVTMPFGQSNKPVPALAPNAEAVILSDNITHEMGTQGYYYDFKVDARDAVGESNEQNNYHGNNNGYTACLYPPTAPDGLLGLIRPRPRLR